MRVCALVRITGAIAVLCPAVVAAQTPAECTRNPDRTRWFVRAGTAADAAGTRDRPLGSLADIERSATAPSRLDESLCRVVRTGSGVDNAASILRGCTARQVASVTHGIMLLADDGAGAASIDYTLQRVVIRDNPSHEKPEGLWPAARGELYNLKTQGSPSGIDGRFHLGADPRPPT